METQGWIVFNEKGNILGEQKVGQLLWRMWVDYEQNKKESHRVFTDAEIADIKQSMASWKYKPTSKYPAKFVPGQGTIITGRVQDF